MIIDLGGTFVEGWATVVLYMYGGRTGLSAVSSPARVSELQTFRRKEPDIKRPTCASL